MTQFIGRWKLNLSSFKNFDEFCKAGGMPADFKETCRNTETDIIFSKDGDTWTYDFVPNSTVMPRQTFIFKPGEELITTSMGKGIRFTIVFESDTKLIQTEYTELMGWKQINITREVNGSLMDNMLEIEGVQMEFQMTKC